MILDKFSLAGKVAIVTGSDTGLGQGFSKAFVEAGAKVLGVSVVPSTATQEMLGEENFQFMCADLSTLDPIDSIINTALEKFGQIDILVNNAGVVDDAYLLMINEDSLSKSLDINIKGYFHCAQQAALKAKLEEISGKQVVLHLNVDPQLIGGLRVDLEGRRYDNSIRTRLDRMRRSLMETEGREA